VLTVLIVATVAYVTFRRDSKPIPNA
jgi:hypothetical protein